MRPVLPLAAALLLALPLSSARAQDSVTIYRCTDAAGNVTVQNDTPCPAGATQSKRTLEGVPSAPSPTAAPVVRGTPMPPVAPLAPTVAAGDAPPPAPAAAAPPTVAPLTPPGVIPAASQPPPPPLYECRAAVGGGVRWADSADPAERCGTMLTADGGGTCDVDLSTPCVSVPPGDLCEAWEERLRSIQLGTGLEATMAARAEIARAQAVVEGTTCALTR